MEAPLLRYHERYTEEMTMATQIQDSDLSKCIKHCLSCYRVCLETVHRCLDGSSKRIPLKDIALLQFCADVCELSFKALAAESDFHHQTCALCAEVCVQCSQMCAKYEEDSLFIRCAEICANCAISCQHMAGITARIYPSQFERSEGAL